MTDLSIVDDKFASYLDIDDILMTEEKISCQAKYDLLNIDFRRSQDGRKKFQSKFRPKFPIKNFDQNFQFKLSKFPIQNFDPNSQFKTSIQIPNSKFRSTFPIQNFDQSFQNVFRYWPR